MKRALPLFTLIACAAALTVVTRVDAAQPLVRRAAPKAASGAVKAASDQAMQTGLTALQAAASDLQGGNASQAGSDLQSAISAMQSAKPIYRGYRERSIHSADVALKALGGKKASPRVAAIVARAIQDAKTALATN